MGTASRTLGRAVRGSREPKVRVTAPLLRISCTPTLRSVKAIKLEHLTVEESKPLPRRRSYEVFHDRIDAVVDGISCSFGLTSPNLN